MSGSSKKFVSVEDISKDSLEVKIQAGTHALVGDEPTDLGGEDKCPVSRTLQSEIKITKTLV